jgi:hypothetical protein
MLRGQRQSGSERACNGGERRPVTREEIEAVSTPGSRRVDSVAAALHARDALLSLGTSASTVCQGAVSHSPQGMARRPHHSVGLSQIPSGAERIRAKVSTASGLARPQRRAGVFRPQRAGDGRVRRRVPSPDTTARTAAGGCRRVRACASGATGVRHAWSTASADVWRSAC